MTIRRFAAGVDSEPVSLDDLCEAEQSRVLENIFKRAAERLGYTEKAPSKRYGSAVRDSRDGAGANAAELSARK